MGKIETSPAHLALIFKRIEPFKTRRMRIIKTGVSRIQNSHQLLSGATPPSGDRLHTSPFWAQNVRLASFTCDFHAKQAGRRI